MKTIVEITKATKKPFKTSEGGMLDYFWYKAIRANDGVTFEFGSSSDHKVGKTLSLDIEKVEKPDGTFRYAVSSQIILPVIRKKFLKSRDEERNLT